MRALVSDFDGTITERDFYSVLASRYVPASAPDYFDMYSRGLMSHFDAMAAYYAYAPTDESEFAAMLDETEPDPLLAAAAERLQNAGWELIIVSAGSSLYIDRILSKAGVRARVYSNPGRLEPGRGLVMEKPVDSPFFSPELGIDKTKVVRDALSRFSDVAYAGNGLPDVAPGLLVSPQRRFARSFMAEELARRGAAYQPFERWSAVVEALL